MDDAPTSSTTGVPLDLTEQTVERMTFTVSEAATLIGVSERRVRQLMRQRPETGLRRYGRENLVPMREIIEWRRELSD